MFMAASESMVIYFFMFSLFGESIFVRDDSVLALGQLCFTAAVIFINTKLLYEPFLLSPSSHSANKIQYP
jgi:phospholipid-translocating ATPase